MMQRTSISGISPPRIANGRTMCRRYVSSSSSQEDVSSKSVGIRREYEGEGWRGKKRGYSRKRERLARCGREGKK